MDGVLPISRCAPCFKDFASCPRYESDEVRSLDSNSFFLFFLHTNWDQLCFIHKLLNDREALVTRCCTMCLLDFQKSELSAATTDAGQHKAAGLVAHLPDGWAGSASGS